MKKPENKCSQRKKPILITGSHRSGSTWAGRMLALDPTVSYIHEPFNLQHRPGICRSHFDKQFTYISKENESQYLNDLDDCLSFKYNLIEELKISKTFKDYFRSLREFSRFTKSRILKKRPLVKDPIALFSAEWLAQQFNMDVVILIRHPAAFAGSLKTVGWLHPFNHFIEQPLLMRHHLYEYESEINHFIKYNKCLIDQSILLWNIIHHMILNYKKIHENWIFVRHEDLSSNPIEEFKKIYNKLGLNFSDKVKNNLITYTYNALHKKINNPKQKLQYFSNRINENYLYQFMRNSKLNITSWKNRLSSNEIDRIMKKTKKISRQFYSEKDWV